MKNNVTGNKTMQTFVSLDFETANPKRVSACMLGGCVVEGNAITDSFSTFIKPPPEFGEFAPMNVRVHGITPDRVVDAPTFGELFGKFDKRVGGRVVISYSKFDLSVINSLQDYYGCRSDFDYVDVCALAKERIPGLKNYKLPTVARHLGLGDFKHHDAADDAVMCAKVFISLMQADSEKSIDGCRPSAKESFSDAFSSFAAIITEDGIVNYKEAVELQCFLDVLPPNDAVMRLRESVSDFLSDGVITQEESDVLMLQLAVAAELFKGTPNERCSVCGGLVPKKTKCQCPWCLADEVFEDGLCDEAQRHLDAIGESMQ